MVKSIWVGILVTETESVAFTASIFQRPGKDIWA